MTEVFTFTRYLACPDKTPDKRADGLLFSRKEPYTQDEALAVLAHPIVAPLLTPKETIIITYFRAASEEFRLILTMNPFHVHPFVDRFGTTKIGYHVGEEWRFQEYGDTLNQCVELYRDAGPEPCFECPKKGRVCVSEKFSLRKDSTWPFIMGPLCSDPVAKGLRLNESNLSQNRNIIQEREDYIHAQSLHVKNRTQLEEILANSRVLGHKFVHPDLITLPSRKPAEVRVFRPPYMLNTNLYTSKV